ncbi:hypothetical protein P280DRAFT_472240 [Massarina eburnea CBS 473.64]|uniref:Phosphatidylglycerol/phosphatidylinositol transfer protein n=1 Tax=Massarina eburnea CBS 473.64 TaxID=1395130 RepID=A0A6A6RR08_9PLEO|nr:hypothetical protein P280DRAFT_472240 [Massarina eburnea CBS 473.64]
MKLTAVLLAATTVATVSATPSWVPGQVTVKEDFKVPGENPLYFCADPKDNILEIENVDLSPNPPQPGSTLTIKAKGDFKDKIEGGKMHLQVKYGLITLINQDADLCETIGKADLECPLDKGEMKLTKDVDLPREIPPGTYTVLADVYDKEGEKITCLTSKISFHR